MHELKLSLLRNSIHRRSSGWVSTGLAIKNLAATCEIIDLIAVLSKQRDGRRHDLWRSEQQSEEKRSGVHCAAADIAFSPVIFMGTDDGTVIPESCGHFNFTSWYMCSSPWHTSLKRSWWVLRCDKLDVSNDFRYVCNSLIMITIPQNYSCIPIIILEVYPGLQWNNVMKLIEKRLDCIVDSLKIYNGFSKGAYCPSKNFVSHTIEGFIYFVSILLYSFNSCDTIVS